MTDRVIEISLIAPRPDLLSRLAQPEMAIIRNGQGTGPFSAAPQPQGVVRLSREITSPDDETTTREELLLHMVDAGMGLAVARRLTMRSLPSPPERPTWCSGGPSPICR